MPTHPTPPAQPTPSTPAQPAHPDQPDQPARPAGPQRKRRGDSFLGIHFDLHANTDCTHMGRGVTDRMVERIIDRVEPDYIQCDCKGHPGFSSYPTKVGYAAPGFVKDPLRVWRRVTARRGVALYMHYSGVFDQQAIKHHPTWARIDEQGKRDKKNTSVFGPYVDKLLIPQLKELCDKYDVDGVWIDGECWATQLDYGKRVLQDFRKTTGIKTIPRKLDDPYYFEFAQFCREAFRKYLRHYVEALHQHNRRFQIASNWAFSGHMPEPVSVDVDFLSGDYFMADSVRAARFEGRVLMQQGLAWDLMAWGFVSRREEMATASTKTAVQLQQEAAQVLALGGGFQTYYKQNRDGAIYEWEMDVMAQVARFCRERQAICHRAVSVPQIALVNSSTNYYRKSRYPFIPSENQLVGVRGVLNVLLDNQQHVDVLSEHHLSDQRMADYPLIILPECEYLAEAFCAQLVAYVKAGGNLLIIGPRAAGRFQVELGVSLKGQVAQQAHYLAHDGALVGIASEYQQPSVKRGVRAVGKLYPENDARGAARIAGSVRRLGRGSIAAIYFTLGEWYDRARSTVLRDFVGSMVNELHRDPLVQVTGSHHVDVTVMRQGDGKTLAVNLVNTAGPHADENVYTFDDIPRLGPLEVAIRYPRRPGRVTLEPGSRELPFSYRQERIHIQIPALAIHEVIVVQ